MIYSFPMHLYTRVAAFLRHRIPNHNPAGASVAALVLMLGLPPALLSTPLGAQEVAQATQAVSVNINAANAETLAEGLTGVGLSRAQEIIRHREAYGPFVSADELAEVKGIGKSTIDKNRPVDEAGAG